MTPYAPFRGPWGRMASPIPFTLVAAAAWLAACSEVAPERQAFVERLGTDTTSMEVFTRTADGFEGDLLTRNPMTRVAHYRASLSSNGTVSSYELDWRTPNDNPGGPPPQHVRMVIEGDSATVVRTTPEGADTSRVAAPAGTIPAPAVAPAGVATWEQAVRQAMASGSDEYGFSFLFPGRPQPARNRVVRRAADSVSMDFFGSPLLARIDADGRVLGMSGRETTMKVEVEPAEGLDEAGLARLAGEFAARDARGEGLGVPSPKATARTRSAGANFEVVYSRPAKRGRKIFGGLVPWNEVWRTGANAATQFTTDRDLRVGDAEVPAGAYTLWTMFTPDSAILIINSETGQWGTAYDVTHDFARVPLEREKLEEPVERFTIDIRPTEDGGVLELSWDTSRFSVPLKVR